MGVDVASFGDPFPDAIASRVIHVRRPVPRAVQEAGLQRRRAACSAASWSATPPNSARCLTRSKADALRDPRRAGARPASRRAGRPPRRRPGLLVQQRQRRQILRRASATRTSPPSRGQGVHAGRHRLRRLPAARHRPVQGELKAAGKKVSNALCEHFACTRQELFEIVKIKRHQDVRRR